MHVGNTKCQPSFSLCRDMWKGAYKILVKLRRCREFGEGLKALASLQVQLSGAGGTAVVSL